MTVNPQDARCITVTYAALCLTCKQIIVTGEKAWWAPGKGVWHDTCRTPDNVGALTAMRAITGERFRQVPPHVRAALTTQSRIGVLLILAGFLVDVMLAMKVLAYETQPSWVLTCVLFGPGVLLMMFGSHLISKKFSGAVSDLIRAIRGMPTKP